MKVWVQISTKSIRELLQSLCGGTVEEIQCFMDGHVGTGKSNPEKDYVVELSSFVATAFLQWKKK